MEHYIEEIPSEYVPFPLEEMEEFFYLVVQYGIDKLKVRQPDNLENVARFRYKRVQRNHRRFQYGATIQSVNGIHGIEANLYYSIYTEPSESVYKTDVLERALLALIETVFHELTHVKQGFERRLVATSKGKQRWRPWWSPIALPYREPKVFSDYWNLPWEVEARRNQKEYTLRFLREFEFDKDSPLSQVFNKLKSEVLDSTGDTLVDNFDPSRGTVLFQSFWINDPFITLMNIKENERELQD